MLIYLKIYHQKDKCKYVDRNNIKKVMYLNDNALC